MEEKSLDSWAAFERELHKLEGIRAERCERSATHVSELLFRGQSDASWSLSTTLERLSESETSIAEYLRIVQSIKPEIETFTDHHWDLPRELEAQVVASLPLPQPVVAYEYMAYLRHQCFPSPLLDWTSSPYVAAHFAFSTDRAERVSIYAYLEYAGHGKSGWAAEPQIHSLGPTIRAAKSHFLQRSQYTFCYRRHRDDGPTYCPHEHAFARDDRGQDLLWKFSIPASERSVVLAHLDRYNISAFSLFGSEESLLQSLAYREFVLRR